MATTLLKVYMLEVFDALSRYHPGVELRCYVDDVDLFCARRQGVEAAERLAAAAVRLLDLFERAFRLRVAHHKCVLLGSSLQTGDRLRHLLRNTGVRLEAWGKKLGVQFSLQLRAADLALFGRGRRLLGAVRAALAFFGPGRGLACVRSCTVRWCCLSQPTVAAFEVLAIVYGRASAAGYYLGPPAVSLSKL